MAMLNYLSSLSPNEPPTLRANILLVDDHPGNLLALRVILEDLGHTLVDARSGQEALRLVLDQDFALILLDVQMDGMDGFETAKLIRGRQRSRHTPIVFLTAFESGRLPMEEAYALGAVDYLVKPLVPVVLRAKVAGFIELFQKTEQVKWQAEQLRQMERRAFERKLAEENARFRALTEQSSDAVTLVGADGIVRYTSPSARRVLGYEPDEFLGRSGFEIVHPDDQERIGLRLAELVRTPGAPVTADLRVLHKDGSWRWVECVGTNLLAEPAVEAIVVNFRDITERRRAIEALRESEEQFRTLADSIPQLAWMARPDGGVFWYNKRWYDYTGTAAEQMEGWGWQSVHDPAELPRVLEKFQAHIASGEPWEDTFPLRRHDGAMRWHLSRALPVRDEREQIVRWFGTNTDITDRIEMEAALKQSDRRKDEFLAMLAHELRNPLAPIRNAVQIMQLLGPVDPNLQRAQEMIERQVKHLARLVDDLLDVSRITSGKIKLRKESVELAAILARAVETSRPLIDARRHELTITLPPESLRLEADTTRLAQVISNLLNNAAKYTEEGGRIGLTVKRERAEAVLSVKDNGMGIPTDLLPHVFDLFTQGDRSLARSEGGLGIGLTLVKSLVEMHGGTVEASSEGPNKGSEFVISLPLQESRSRFPTNEEERLPCKHETSASRRILVVDDNVDAAESLALVLRAGEHEVHAAHDGPTALRIAETFRPDVVLLDIGLPRMDGYEVARRLRKQTGTETVFLVALTGYGQDEDRRQAEEAGFDAHLTKPADPAVLQKLLATSPRI
ncbi:MAG TPA: response regulator [Gemmataceae bacterium]|nr:response regulator [Gemmataceae bacterium]